MIELLLHILAFAYLFTGIVGVIAYWPTIKDLSYHKKPSANVASYLLWTITGLIAFLYAIFILPDILFVIVSGLNFLCCALIWILRMRIKN